MVHCSQTYCHNADTHVCLDGHDENCECLLASGTSANYSKEQEQEADAFATLRNEWKL
jgi:hypothetical protein